MKVKAVVVSVAALAATTFTFAQEANRCKLIETKAVADDNAEVLKSNSFSDVFKNGKVSGEIGSYFETTGFKKNRSADFGWQNVYMGLKYETAKWNNLKLGAKFFAHGKVFDDNSAKSNGRYDKGYKTDIEDNYALSELYLDWSITDKTNLRAGRFDHQKISHIDDTQSEGFYLQSRDIENLTLTLGAITRFAEIDYDDLEGFGTWEKDADKQDLSNSVEYPDAWDFVAFAEAVYDNKKGVVVNPYLYMQDGYASVLGMDTNFSTKLTDNLTVGTKLMAYNVFADKNGYDDAFVWGLEPYAKVGGFTASVGYVDFDGDGEGNKAMNKPTWFRDYMLGFDQDRKYAEQNCSVYFGRLRYDAKQWAAWVQYGVYQHGVDQDKEARELELQAQYKFKSVKGLDFNVRLFDVDFNDGNDYQKVEARLRYKF